MIYLWGILTPRMGEAGDRSAAAGGLPCQPWPGGQDTSKVLHCWGLGPATGVAELARWRAAGASSVAREGGRWHRSPCRPDGHTGCSGNGYGTKIRIQVRPPRDCQELVNKYYRSGPLRHGGLSGGRPAV